MSVKQRHRMVKSGGGTVVICTGKAWPREAKEWHGEEKSGEGTVVICTGQGKSKVKNCKVARRNSKE